MRRLQSPLFRSAFSDQSPCVVVMQTEQGTPLHEAVMYCRPAVVRFLLHKGSDVTICNSAGCTPLGLLSENSSLYAEAVDNPVIKEIRLLLESKVIFNGS